MKKEDEHLTTQDEVIEQLAVIKQRLETYPFANHEATCMKDCMLLLIRTFAGEKVPELQLARIGGGTMETSHAQGASEFINGEMRVGGVEIAPGVVQYPAAPTVATIDVEASQRELDLSLAPTKAPLPGLPTPLPNSLMAQALANEAPREESAPASRGESEAIAQIHSQAQGAPKGIPSPSETKLEITS